MTSTSSDKAWQRMPKSRRARVYRAIGHASREARLDGDPEVAEDLRTSMNVLRAHGRAAAPPRTKRGHTARKTRRRR